MCEIEGRAKRLIIDTGSNVSILQPGVSSSEIQESLLKPFGVTGEDLNVRGQQQVSFTLGGHRLDHVFLVCPLPTETAGLLGMDFFEKLGAEISFKKRTLTLSDRPEIQTEHSGMHAKHVAFRVFTQGKARHGSKPKQGKESSLARHPSERYVSVLSDRR